jgi:hypothetical protein
MFTKKALACALIAASMIGATAIPPLALAATSFDIQLNFAPPPAQYERVPNPRAGYVWSPGHWQWNGNSARHVWVAGNWERARAGYAYRAPRWIERNGRWQFESSRWDRNRDGMPDRADANPYGEGFRTPPPAPRYERLPAARAGYAWSPGHWEWRSGRHEWIAGNWVQVRNGYAYTAPRWTENNGRWQFESRRWDRDRNRDSDRDGIPDRRDPTPMGDRRPGDRDGDGVPDRRDANPDNPYRR